MANPHRAGPSFVNYQVQSSHWSVLWVIRSLGINPPAECDYFTFDGTKTIVGRGHSGDPHVLGDRYGKVCMVFDGILLVVTTTLSEEE